MYALHPFIKHVPHLAVAFTRSDNDIVIVTNRIRNIRNNSLGTAQFT
jgi:hypothetical protein